MSAEEHIPLDTKPGQLLTELGEKQSESANLLCLGQEHGLEDALVGE